MAEHLSRSSVTHTTPDGIPAAAAASDDASQRSSGDPATDRRWDGWRRWTPGTRVVVRRRLAEGGWTDVLGDLLSVTPDGVVVRTRGGDVPVPGPDIALGKPVPPAPPRRAPRAP